MARILVAGATGRLGRWVVRELGARGHAVRAMARDPARLDALGLAPDEAVRADLADPASLAAACAGVDAVVSCAGASMALGPADRRAYASVDLAGNRALLDAARAAGVRRFVYVSVALAPGLRETAYVDAHERFVEALRASGMPHAVVRPTGFFSTFAELVPMARRGPLPLIGDGRARTNPVHEADVAVACADALEGSGAEIVLGGPEVLTRREIDEAAFRAVGRAPRMVRVPAGVFRAMAWAARPVHPRMAALLEFGAAAGVVDCIAPARGTRTLADYLAEAASGA